MDVRLYTTPDFLRFHEIIEEFLNEYPDKFLEVQFKKYPEPDFYTQDGIGSEYNYIKEEFPLLFRYSFLLTCYSYFEHVLFQECKIEKNIKSLPLDVTDLTGKGIEQAKNYLIKVARIDFPINDWEEIKNIQKIRNFIVHKEGNLDKSKNATTIRNYISKRHDIFIENDKIILSADYCKNVMEIIFKFLSHLYNPKLKP